MIVHCKKCNSNISTGSYDTYRIPNTNPQQYLCKNCFKPSYQNDSGSITSDVIDIVATATLIDTVSDIFSSAADDSFTGGGGSFGGGGATSDWTES